MKKRTSRVFICIFFLVGLSLLLYPSAANQWNNYRQKQLISHYENTLEVMEPADFDREWEKAESYNDALREQEKELLGKQYRQVLDTDGDGMMGYLSIPAIHMKLSIYHGTGDEVLRVGIGHLEGTALPIGGAGTHAVLAAHRGLPSAKLFTDIDQLQEGDAFYIHLLDEVLAYKVDRILPMVEKDDYKTLDEALKAEEGKDYVTLFTCTPYGVNSHRLLVRGSRVPYNGEEDAAASVFDSVLGAVRVHYIRYLLLGLAVTIVAIFIIKFLFKKKESRGKQ